MRRFREVVRGRFTTPADAHLHPDTTVAETISDAPEQLANLRWRAGELEVALLQAADALRRRGAPVTAASYERLARARIPEETAAG